MDYRRLLWTIIRQQIVNLKEGDKYLETYILPRQNHAKIENRQINNV